MSRATAPRQLPLDLGVDPAFTRDDLVETGANAAAVAFIDGWPNWPGPVAVLAGPSGAGKTHLAEIWRKSTGATVLHAASVEARLDPAGPGGPWLIDDADSADLDQTGLFHLINVARETGSHVLLTARRFPGAWAVTLPDLASRLKAASVIEIQEPDDDLLAGVIAKLFADRQIEVEPQIITYIVRRIERSLATAINVVDRLDYAALSQHSRITRALAAEIISSIDGRQAQLPF